MEKDSNLPMKVTRLEPSEDVKRIIAYEHGSRSGSSHLLDAMMYAMDALYAAIRPIPAVNWEDAVVVEPLALTRPKRKRKIIKGIKVFSTYGMDR